MTKKKEKSLFDYSLKKKEYTFIDFFCGAGGFSEGFRQQGFKPIRGIDLWKPAIETHNLNFGLNDEVKDILDFENDEEIEHLEDSDIIIGSPPCVSFSMANKAGKADKSLGIRLIEAFLRVVAVKKHKPNSILKAWYMENVPNSRNFVNETYSFTDLNLSKWAVDNGINPLNIALHVKNNGDILNSSDYGSPQKRERFICGEYIQRDEKNKPIKEYFLFPTKTHDEDNIIVLKDILSKMPSPISKNNKKIQDPNYPSLLFDSKELIDHFYDTGLYKMEWEQAKRAKTNHPFMGKMSFPENINKPSRTIMATRGGSTRESLIYKSEFNRKGHGEYRLPTIREAATLMGFPYVYNFTGTQATKWKQIGNAVSPHMSFAIAKALKQKLDIENVVEHDNIIFTNLIKINDEINQKKHSFNNLNSMKPKAFNKPPKRKKGAKFRRHFIKGGNMTVALMNYSVEDSSIDSGESFFIYVFSGSGKKYSQELVKENIYTNIHPFILEKLDKKYHGFIKESEKICKNIPNKKLLQKLYEEDNRDSDNLDLETFFAKGEKLILNFIHTCCADEIIEQPFIKSKINVPVFQILSLYLISLFLSKSSNSNI